MPARPRWGLRFRPLGQRLRLLARGPPSGRPQGRGAAVPPGARLDPPSPPSSWLAEGLRSAPQPGRRHLAGPTDKVLPFEGPHKCPTATAILGCEKPRECSAAKPLPCERTTCTPQLRQRHLGVPTTAPRVSHWHLRGPTSAPWPRGRHPGVQGVPQRHPSSAPGVGSRVPLPLWRAAPWQQLLLHRFQPRPPCCAAARGVELCQVATVTLRDSSGALYPAIPWLVSSYSDLYLGCNSSSGHKRC